jgi:hypothetical protein
MRTGRRSLSFSHLDYTTWAPTSPPRRLQRTPHHRPPCSASPCRVSQKRRRQCSPVSIAKQFHRLFVQICVAVTPLHPAFASYPALAAGVLPGSLESKPSLPQPPPPRWVAPPRVMALNWRVPHFLPRHGPSWPVLPLGQATSARCWAKIGPCTVPMFIHCQILFSDLKF